MHTKTNINAYKDKYKDRQIHTKTNTNTYKDKYKDRQRQMQRQSQRAGLVEEANALERVRFKTKTNKRTKIDKDKDKCKDTANELAS